MNNNDKIITEPRRYNKTNAITQNTLSYIITVGTEDSPTRSTVYTNSDQDTFSKQSLTFANEFLQSMKYSAKLVESTDLCIYNENGKLIGTISIFGKNRNKSNIDNNSPIIVEEMAHMDKIN